MKKTLVASLCLSFLLLAIASASASAAETPSVFAEPPRAVAPSPSVEAEWRVPPSSKVVDFEASPSGGEVALLVSAKAGGAGRVLLWTPGREPVEAWSGGATVLKSVTWHPSGRALFLLATEGGEHRILRLDGPEGAGTAWKPNVIHRSKAPLRRLVAGPRPFFFDAPQGDARKFLTRYRLFFGVAAGGGAWALHSVTEEGTREYQVAGPKATRTRLNTGDPMEAAASYETASALPLSFHPAGHVLLWEDGKKAFQAAHYEALNWGETKPLWGGTVSGGTVTALPNGRGVLHWTPGKAGAAALARGGREATPLAAERTFVTTPSLFPDGKALVGLTREGEGGPETIRAVPVKMPLADVFNAWMFAEGTDASLLDSNGGLFRRIPGDQLYQLYDSELYACGGYSTTSPTRPYLVTTDVMWEAWAAAFEGIFVLREREVSVPAFWSFVDAAAGELAKTGGGAWGRLFAAARASRDPKTTDEEARQIRAHAGTARSSALGTPFDFAELTPRGHYAGAPASRDYFAAMRYLTAAGALAGDAAALRGLSSAVKAKGAAWVSSYDPFIAPPRSPELLREGRKPSPFVRHPGTDATLFPLSFAFDNEVLDSTVFHSTWPAAEQVTGPSGPRLVPSGLDVAAAFGSEVAARLLAGDLAKYPSLKGALDRLAARRPAPGSGASLYERWLEALGTQWADGALAGVKDGRSLWGAKRLQTGLASWATLRHATVLVNERTAAECGEGGFEEIVMAPPRGAVEADPKTFEAIASLFDAAARTVEETRGGLAGSLPADQYSEKPREGLREGLLKRLRGAAEKNRAFARMASRQLKGEALTPDEYMEILYVGRAAEHDFLVFKSLANEKLALSTPDPMPKIADVAGGGQVPILHAAVGLPLELDLVVPYFGRRQVVKGPVYAYHELVSQKPMTDAEWRQRVAREPLAPWIAPFAVDAKLTCPAKPPF